MCKAGCVSGSGLSPMNITASSELWPTTPSLQQIGDLATGALLAEVRAWPKPGLVSVVDSGSHADMDARTFHASAQTLRPLLATLSVAGAENAEMDDLRRIGKAAEQAMLEATGGVNTHRGAIFCLGLLCAAAGALSGRSKSPIQAGHLGTFVRQRWGLDILCGPLPRQSHGTLAWRQYGVGGARAEAAEGFPHVYHVGLPAWRERARLMDNRNAACVQACFALIAAVEDTNLLYRSGPAGLEFARQAAQRFLQEGGVGQREWCTRAAKIHRDFVARKLSPGGSADLLAATLLVAALEAPMILGSNAQRCCT